MFGQEKPGTYSVRNVEQLLVACTDDNFVTLAVRKERHPGSIE